MKHIIIITAVAILEIVALVAIVRLWRQNQSHWTSKFFWSLVLLVPVFGLLFYGFITVTPAAQDDHTEGGATDPGDTH